MPKDLPKMPDGLEDLLRGLSKAVLKEKPPNILEFSAKYFENLLIERDGSLMKNYERFENYEKSLDKILNQKKTNGDNAKKKVKSAGKNKKTVTDPKVVKSSAQKNEKVSSPIFGDKVVENELTRKSTEAILPRGKLKVRTRSSISLNAITEESNSEMKAERRLMYRNAVQKIQRAFRRYMETKKQNSPALQTDAGSNPPSQPIKNEDEAAKIIQNLFKSKFRKKTTPTQQRPQSIKNKNLERVSETGEDGKSLLDYLQEEENAKKVKPNIEHDSDTGETLTSKMDGMKISKADSLENMIINEDMNRQQNSKNLPLHQEQEAVPTKIQQENVTPIPAAEMIQDALLYKTQQQGEMEQAAVKIQKNYRGYKVRKDIISTKNLVNSGNLVAATGNIIGSVVNHLSPSINSDKPVDNSDTILSDVSEIRGTVADSAESLNKEIASEEMVKLTDPVSNINDTNLEDVVSSSIHEVSQNTAQDIELVIGINKQEHTTKIDEISMDGDTTKEGDFVEDKAPVSELNDAAKDFEGVDEPKHRIESIVKDAITIQNNPGLELLLNSETTGSSEHGTESTATNATNHENSTVFNAPPNESKHELKHVANEANVSLNSTEAQVDSPENLMESDDMATHQISPVLDDPLGSVDIRTYSPGESQSLQGGGTVELKHETKHLATDSTAHQNDNEEISTDSLVSTKHVQDLGTVKPQYDVDARGDALQSVQEASTAEPNHEANLFATDATAQNHPVLDIPLNRVDIRSDSPGLQNHSDPDVPLNSAEKHADSPAHVMKSHEVATHQNSSVLDDPLDNAEIRTHSPGEKQSLQEGGTVEPTHEPKSLATVQGIDTIVPQYNIEPVINGPLNRTEIRTDSPGEIQSIQEADSAELKHEANVFATDATAQNHPILLPSKPSSDSPGEVQNVEVADSSDAVALQNHPDPNNPLNSTEKQADSPEHVMESHEVVTHQNSAVLDDPHGNAEIRTQSQTKPFVTDSTALQRETVEIINDSPEPFVNETLNNTELRTDSPDEAQSVQEADSAESKHEAKLFATDAVAPLKSAESLDDIPVRIQNVRENGINAQKLRTEPLATEATIHQNNSVPADTFNSSEIRNDSPAAPQNVQGLDTVVPGHVDTLNNPNIRADSPNKLQNVEEVASVKDETKSLATDPTSLQNHSVLDVPINSEISTDTQNIEEVPHSVDQHTFYNQDSLPDLNDPEMADAALKIQKSFRGHQARKETQQKDATQIRAAHIIPEVTVDGASEEMLSDSEPMDIANPASKPEINEAAVKIQKTFRGHQVRKELKGKKANLISAETQLSESLPISLQPEAKEAHGEQDQFHTSPDHHNAALKIQKTYRGHQVRKELKQKNAEIVNSADSVGNSITVDNLNPANLIASKDLAQHPINANVENNHPDLNDSEIIDADSNIKADNHPALQTQEDLVNPDFTSNKEDFEIDPKRVDAAGKIQKSYRDYKVRKEYKERKKELQQKTASNLTSLLEIDHIASAVDPLQLDSVISSADELTNNNVIPEHQDSLPDLNDPEMANAAVKIQKSFRGHQARKDATNIRKKRSLDFHEEPSDNNLESVPATNEENGTTQSSLEDADATLKIEKLLRGVEQPIEMADDDLGDATTTNTNSISLEHQESLPDLNDPEMADAALKIQKSFRGHQARKEQKQSVIINLSDLPATEMADTASQLTIGDSKQPPLEHEDSLPDLNDPEIADAALKIQKSFRGHQARRDIKQQKSNKFSESVEPMPITTEDLETNENTLLNMPDPPTPENATEIKHQDSLPDLTDPEMADAAVKIQKSFRGHQARREQKKHETQSTLTVEPAVNKPVDPQDLKTLQFTIDADKEKLVVVSSINQAEHQDSLPDLNDPEMADAAVKIQKSFRGHQARKEQNKSEHQAFSSTDLNQAETLHNSYAEMDLTNLPAIELAHEGSQLIIDAVDEYLVEPDKNDSQPASDTTISLPNLKDNNVTNEPLTNLEPTTTAQIDKESEIKIRVEHQDSLPDLNDPEMNDAALKIQKSFRGHKARKEASNNNPVPPAENAAVDDTQDDAKLASSLLKNQDSLPDLTDPEMTDAALKIQKSFRGHKARKEFKETKENSVIEKILSEATAPPADEPAPQIVEKIPKSDLIAKATETAAINIQRTYRGYRTRRDLKSQNPSTLVAAATFEDENKLVDSLEPILDQKSNDEDKIDADSLDNFNVEERTEVVEEPCQKIVYKSKLSMLIENSKSESNSDKVELKPNDDYFDSLENGQISEMDESPQTVIEVQQPGSSCEAQNTYDSNLFGIKVEPEHEEHEENDSVSRKTTAEVNVPDTKVETRGGMTDDEIKEIQNIDLASFEKDSLEAMYYSLRKNELRLDQMHSLSNVEQISDQTEPPRQFTAKQKLLSMGESDSDDIVFKQMSIDYEEYPEISRQHTARSTTDDDDADVEVVRNVLYYNDGKQILPNSGEVKREPGDGASVASDNLFDNHSNADEQDVLTKSRAHNFEIFSLDEEIKNLESNVAPHQQDNPLFYAQQKIEKFLHQIHGNRNETEDDADDENDDEFLENPIDSSKSYLSENNFNVEDEEEDDVVDELKNDFRESSGKKILTSAVSEADSDYIELSRAKPIKDDFNISTALDNYLSTDSDSTYNSAATKIQAGARGFLTRRRIQSINRQSISERRSSIGNAAIDQSLDDMIEENEERKKFKFHEAQSTFREDTITSSGEMEVYGITDIKVEEKKITSPITDSGNESTTSIDTETQSHLRNKYEHLENESSFDAIDEDNLNDVVDVIRTSNVQNKLRSPIKNKTLSNLNFDEYERVTTRRMTLQRGNAVQGNSTPSDEESRSNPSGSSTATTTTSEETNDQKDVIDGKKTSYDSPIRRKSNDSASLMAKSSNSLPDMQTLPKKRGFIQRQRTMPVQIETEIIRQLPKHMRKRIKSANSSAHSSYHASKKKATY